MDTYEPTQNGTQSSSTSKQSTGNKSGSDWEVVPDLTEEEQLRILNAEEQWNTVKTKKPKKKTNESPEASAAESAPVPKKVADSAPAHKKPAAVKQTSSFAALKDEGANLKDNDESNVVGVWEEGKGFTKGPKKSAANVRISIFHEFVLEDHTGNKELITSYDEEW